MKNLITVFLLLGQLLLGPRALRAALVFDPEYCCAADSGGEDAHTLNASHLNDRGSQLYAAGDYANAEKALRESLEIQQAQTNPNPELLSGTLFNLAAVARMESRMEEAEALYQRSIAVRESAWGADWADLARPLTGLAMVYLADGRIGEAVDLAERAVRVSANRPGDVRQMAAARNTLATVLMATGDSRKAETLTRKAVEQLKGASETGTPEYVDALTNLGTSRLRQLRYGQAELDLREAEAAALKVLGADHVQTAMVWNNLGKTREAAGDAKAAKELFEKAIGVWRKALGPNHPDVARGLSNLAELYQGRKRYAEAERLYRQALEIDQASLGANSLRVANDWNNLGALAATRRHFAEAEAGLAKGLSIAEQRVGSNHPDSAGIAVNLGVVQLSQGKYEEASALFAKALPVKERVLGPDSPELASILRLYARSLKADQDYAAAAKAELQATRIATRNTLLADNSSRK